MSSTILVNGSAGFLGSHFIDCMLNDKVIPIHEATVRSQANGEIINIGNTEEVTILELARRIKRLSTRKTIRTSCAGCLTWASVSACQVCVQM